MGVKKGYIPWNKGFGGYTNSGSFKKNNKFWIGRKHIEKAKYNMSVAKLGKHYSLKTEFKKGNIPWNKNKPYYALRKEKNPRWRGGITEKERKKRETLTARRWKRRVLKRDDYTCQDCGMRDIVLNVHHILPFSQFKKYRHKIWNGVTLCRKCHIKEHGSEECKFFLQVHEVI